MTRPGKGYAHRLIDETGKVLAGVEVLRREERPSRYLRERMWICKIIACGCEVMIPGGTLRQMVKQGKTRTCTMHTQRRGKIRNPNRTEEERKAWREKARAKAAKVNGYGHGGICKLCGGLPWRVTGDKCRRCNLPRGEEQADGIQR